MGFLEGVGAVGKPVLVVGLLVVLGEGRPDGRTDGLPEERRSEEGA